MRVLVTGGAGYIGSHTSLRLLEEGHQVAVLDNFINSGRESLERVESLAGGDIEVHEVDVRDPSTFESFFKNWRPESVIHFAGLKSVSESVENPGSYYTTNVQGTVNVAQSSVANDVRSLIFSSSATVYRALHT
ncbi:SDR family NAD(P)-dependent oxidoreductase [Micrococcus terreus]|uniref:SDR family NAD(P)-dependent oxidoreductase n=1 Tax=Micrococcus terreus TaxID=574650 RepID=UPI003CCD1A3D